MGKSKFDKKNCLRFKLVHRSVRPDAFEEGQSRGHLDYSLGEASPAGIGDLYAGDREFVPLNRQSEQSIVSCSFSVSSRVGQ